MKRAALLLILLVTACYASPELPRPTETGLPSGDIPALSTPASLPSGASVDRTRYRLDVIYDYPTQQLTVTEWIDYLNGSETYLDEILLVVEAENVGADFELDTVIRGDGLELIDYTHQPGVLSIPLAERLAPGDTLTLGLSYRLRLPQEEGALSAGARQANFADWYPFVPPRDAQGWVLQPAARVGEHLVYESANFEVAIWTRGAPEELLIAAPAPAQDLDGGWAFSLQNARRFAWSASVEYVLRSNEAVEIPIKAYVFSGHEEAAEHAIAISAEAMALYEDLYGPYPYEILSIIEADFPDGMESDALFWLYAGFFEISELDSQNYLSTLTSHEVAHNWWYGRVGNNAALEPWLDEAYATYSELLYYEDAYPELVDWWWTFRILNFAPTGVVNSSIYDHDFFAPYIHAVYFRGALFLDALRVEIGDEAFFALIKDVQAQGAGQIVDRSFFFGLLGEHTDEDVSPLIEEYFNTP